MARLLLLATTPRRVQVALEINRHRRTSPDLIAAEIDNRVPDVVCTSTEARPGD